mmetsp:Transcript_18394/g.25778  ORF Transcript_18394/g.25778 Transcript_18394/m.25778 type:complete len:113 (-) Transcript_18394:1261-1599(-)
MLKMPSWHTGNRRALRTTLGWKLDRKTLKLWLSSASNVDLVDTLQENAKSSVLVYLLHIIHVQMHNVLHTRLKADQRVAKLPQCQRIVHKVIQKGYLTVQATHIRFDHYIRY